MLITFTDFGANGPYIGQVKAVLHRLAPTVPVIDLLTDAPAFDPQCSAYLLAAFAPEFLADAVFLAVVDPGVGGNRAAVVVQVDGQRFVGPDNGLFELLIRRGRDVRAWGIVWAPDRLSSTFHGRDLFAPVAARLAAGQSPEAAGCIPIPPPRRADWPDDLTRIVYLDHYGNAMTGLRVATLPLGAVLRVGGRSLKRANTYSDVPRGEAFWYENSSGLAEIAIHGGRAADALGLEIGSPVEITEA